MKRAKFITIMIIFIFSSSFISNENIESVSSDPLIGTWKIEKLVITYSNGRDVESDLADCSKMIRHSFYSDGTLNFKMTTIEKNTGECILRSDDFWTGTWERSYKNTYITKHVNKFPSGHITGYSDSTTVYTFSTNKKTLTKFRDYEKAGVLYEGEIKPISETVTYTRVE